MRLTLAQLRKLKMPYHYVEELDLNEDLNSFEDIISSSPAHVEGIINQVGLDEYQISMNIKIDLVLESAISCKKVNFSINTETEEIYSTNEDMDFDGNLIVGQTLDTKEAVITSIIIEKPMRVTLPGEEFESEDSSDAVEEEAVNPAFASLKDLIK